MTIRVTIERLVLDGLPVDVGQGPLLGAAIETELSRLVAEHGLADHWLSGGGSPSIAAGAIPIVAGEGVTKLATRIAAAVSGGIGS